MILIVHQLLQQDLANLLAKKNFEIVRTMKIDHLTGKAAESGGVSKVLLFEFDDEDCCQAEELAVSFGILPCVLFRTK